MDSIRAGTTLKLEFTFSNYHSDIYDIEIALRGPGQIDLKDSESGVEIDASGYDYTVEVGSDTTDNWTAGMYWYSIIMTDGTVRHEVETGSVEILQDLSAVSSAYDGRSHVKKTLDAIEAVIEDRASADVLSYAIAGRQISKIPIAELLALRDKYKSEYESEKTAEKLKRGERLGGKILVRF